MVVRAALCAVLTAAFIPAPGAYPPARPGAQRAVPEISGVPELPGLARFPGTLLETPGSPRESRAPWPVLLASKNPGDQPAGKVAPSNGETSKGANRANTDGCSLSLAAAAVGPLAQIMLRTRRLLGLCGPDEDHSPTASPNLGVKYGIRSVLVLGSAALVWNLRRIPELGLASVVGPFFLAGLWGVASGALHSLTGPDHIAGLTALAINQPVGPAVSLASVWAGGHVTGQCFIGAALVLLRAVGAPAIKQVLFEAWATTGIALSLLVIGVVGILEARAGPGEAELTTTGRISRKLLRGTLTTGFVHGLAPDGLVMLLPVLAMPVHRAAAHLFGIFVGTCGAMCMCTAAFCGMARRLEQYAVQKGEAMGRMQARISVGSSIVAIAIGFLMLGEIFL